MAQDEVIIRAVIPSVFFKPRWLQAGKKKQRSKPRGERIKEGREEVTDREDCPVLHSSCLASESQDPENPMDEQFGQLPPTKPSLPT